MHRLIVKEFILSLFVVATLALQADPITRIWKGGTLNDKNEQPWSEPANWENGCPENGDSVYLDNKVDASPRMDIKHLSLVNFVYIDHSSNSAAPLSTYRLEITGKDSSITTAGTGTKALYVYMEFSVADGAKLQLNAENSTICQGKNEVFFGDGVIEKIGDKDLYLNYSNTGFDGIWNLKNSTVRVERDVHPFGSDKCEIHQYGANAEEGTGSGFNFSGNVVIDGEMFVHYKGASSVFALCTFNKDFHFYPNTSKVTLGYNAYPKLDGTPVGYVFNGSFIIHESEGCTGTAQFISYGTGKQPERFGRDMILEFNGPTTVLGSGASSALVPSIQHETTGCVIRVNSPITCPIDTFLIMNEQFKVSCLKPNVLPENTITFGNADRSTHGAVLDLLGNDQTVGPTILRVVSGGENDSVITSSSGPATYNTSVSPGGVSYRVVPYLNGQVSYSLRGRSSNAGAYKFKGGNTTGWIASCWPIDLAASFPNLRGIEITEAAVATFNTASKINSGVRIDIHDLSTGCIRVLSGVNVNVGSVICNDVDLPAGTYCRADVQTAENRVDWMGNAGASGYNGTVTIAEHDPTWVWTGKGTGSSIKEAGNWGVQEVPNLGNARLTLDLRHATADAPIVLDGAVAVKAVSFEKGGFATFSGSGAVTLNGDQTLNAAFTADTSLVYEGGGTLVLKGGVSNGKLIVRSGKVVLEGAVWYGKISVAEEAEMEVRGTVNPFGADDGAADLSLYGKLTLAEGVAAVVRSMEIGGEVSTRKTYGSSDSTAERTDDVHFGGVGIVRALNGAGIILMVK